MALLLNVLRLTHVAVVSMWKRWSRSSHEGSERGAVSCGMSVLIHITSDPLTSINKTSSLNVSLRTIFHESPVWKLQSLFRTKQWTLCSISSTTSCGQCRSQGSMVSKHGEKDFNTLRRSNKILSPWF